MDFGQFNAQATMDEGKWLTLNDPYGDPTDAKIKVVGPDSKTYKRELRRIADLEKKKRNGLKAAEMEQHMIDTYAACCVDFENCYIGKKEVKAGDTESIKELVAMTFITPQISEFIGDYTNFLSK